MEDYVEDGTVLAILAIPSWMTVSDFLTFISPASEGVSHLRIVRSVMIDHVPLSRLTNHSPEMQYQVVQWP